MEISLAMAELAIKITARSQKTPDARPNKPASVAAMGDSAMATAGCNLCWGRLNIATYILDSWDAAESSVREV